MLFLLKNKMMGVSFCIIAGLSSVSVGATNKVFQCTGTSTHYDHTWFMGSLAIERATECAKEQCYDAGFSDCDDVFDTKSWDCNSSSLVRVCGFARVRGSN